MFVDCFMCLFCACSITQKVVDWFCHENVLKDGFFYKNQLIGFLGIFAYFIFALEIFVLAYLLT